MIEIDGAAGEGGGQILRTALALAMCTGQAVALERIRAGRAKPGLMRQHLACVQAAAAVCGARVEGAEIGAQQLRFTPGPVRAGVYEFAVGSAGSCMLVLQTVLPALMLAGAQSRVVLRGGTHNPMAPPFHFIERSFAPLLRRLGVVLDLQLRRHGFFPAGGGEVHAAIGPGPQGGLQPVDVVARGALVQADAQCLAPGLPQGVAARELGALGRELGWPAEQLHVGAARQHEGPGNALMATLAYGEVCEVFTVFGEKGVRAEQVAQELAQQVRSFEAGSGALGPCLADQWMLPLALAVAGQGGGAAFTCTQLTAHARTNMGVIERFLPVGFTAEGGDGCWRVEVRARGAAGA